MITIDQLQNLDLNFLKTLPRSELLKYQKLLTPKMTHYIKHVPTAKQSAFMLLDTKEAFYGGAAGGGKSDALLMCALQHVDIKGYSAIIFRKTFADLVKPGALIDRAKDWLIQFDDVKWVEKERAFYFLDSYGKKRDIRAVLQFGYLDSDNDKYTYQGGEYQFAGFDEMTHFSESNYRYIFSRCRRLKGTNIPIRLRGASNPPGAGQGIWVYNRFVNYETRKPGTIFIPAGLNDNPFLDKTEYKAALQELDPVTRAQLLEGNWTIRHEGNLFKREWFEEVDPTMLPAHRVIVRSWDIASTKPNEKNEDPDWTVGMKVSECNGIFYIEDICRFRDRPEIVESQIKTHALSDGFSVKILEEQQPGAAGQIVIDNRKKVLEGYTYMPERTSGSKINRAEPVSAAAEQGRIKIVRGCRNIKEFYREAEAFPSESDGNHDDMIDALSQAFGKLNVAVPQVPPTEVASAMGSMWADRYTESQFAGWRGNLI